MTDTIDVWGIETNNLMGIDVSIVKHGLNLVIGPSGSGKSSLAYDTIAAIGRHELAAMFEDDAPEPRYRVGGYRNMVAAVPISQSNHNNNVRSTIGTYFGLSRGVARAFAAALGTEESTFTLNREGNCCERCHGLGTVRQLDENRLVDFDKPLKDNPVRCWRRYKDFYSQIIAAFCEDAGIDPSLSFRQLGGGDRHTFLHGESAGKYKIRYKKTGSTSSRTTKYYGVMTGRPMIPRFKIGEQFYADAVCPDCGGRRYSAGVEDFRVSGISIGDLMATPFTELPGRMRDIFGDGRDGAGSFALDRIVSFVSKATELGLGHLCLNRSIPTLSGGELQRLRLVQVFVSQLNDLLVVLDEPLAGLSGREREAVRRNVVELAKRHTLIVVDHSDAFLPESKNTIALGDGGGRQGGKLIDAAGFLDAQGRVGGIPVAKASRELRLTAESAVYSFVGADVTIGLGCLNLVRGSSGVGKSTLLREYFPQLLEKYAYIEQKPLTGNKTSHVVTALDLLVRISTLFADKFHKPKTFFSNQPGCDGACPRCDGAGYLDLGSDGAGMQLRIECAECGGTGFNERLRGYPLAGNTMADVWSMTIDEATPYFAQIDSKMASDLAEASDLLLGHLTLGQPTSALSGGENVRIRLLKARKTKAEFVGVDEPFRGLCRTEILRVALFLDRLRGKGKTIIVADHSESVEAMFARVIRLSCENGVLTGA